VEPGEPPLLDGYLSACDAAEFHACVVNADHQATWETIRHADLSAVRAVRALLMLRAVPGRVKARAAGHAAPPVPPFTFDDMPRVGFALLEERPGEIVLGSVSRPWKVGDERPLALERSAFAAFDDPGYAKIAFSIHARPHGTQRTLVTTETRIASTDARSRRRFAAYWKLIGPFSALIRRAILRRVTSEAETAGPSRTRSG